MPRRFVAWLGLLAVAYAASSAAGESPGGVPRRGEIPTTAPVTYTTWSPLEETAPVPVIAEASDGRCCRWFVEADYLYLRPRRRALDFAINDPNLNAVLEGSVESLDWEARSGIRLSTGVLSDGDGLELLVSYTYFHSEDQRAVAAAANGSLFPTVTRPDIVSQATTAAATAGFDYDVFDFELGRRIAIRDALSVRLSAGAKFALIDQNFEADFNGMDADQARVASSIDFDGAGPRLGVTGNWDLGRGFSFWSKAYGSLLAGEFRTRLVEFNQGGLRPITNLREKYHSIVPVMELGLGLAWQRRNFGVSLGYEVTNWFDFVDSPDLADDTNQGKYLRRTSDLSLDGLVARVWFAY